jgi:hypothetical protein
MKLFGSLVVLVVLATSCFAQVAGGDADEHGCRASAGYQYCKSLGECVRPWELASQYGLENSPEAFDTFCHNAPEMPAIGGDVDEHGCKPSAGYVWCAVESRCVRLFELAQEKQLPLGLISRYCDGKFDIERM